MRDSRSEARRGVRPTFVALVIALAGCAAPPVPRDEALTARPMQEILAGCCDSAGLYPDWLIRLADANVEPLRQLGLIQLRPGRMTDQPELAGMLEAALRPLDVLLFHSDNRVSGLLIPGRFIHGAVYLGTEAQLRAAGLWEMPELAPWRASISAGNIFLEAVDGGVHLSPREVVLDTDAVVALRPRGMNRAQALRRGLVRMGVPFDMHFDAADQSELFCAELIALMFPEAEIPRTIVSGRETILPDAIVAAALTRDLPFGLVGYVEATPGGGARVQSPQELAWDIRQAWPVSR